MITPKQVKAFRLRCGYTQVQLGEKLFFRHPGKRVSALETGREKISFRTEQILMILAKKRGMNLK